MHVFIVMFLPQGAGSSKKNKRVCFSKKTDNTSSPRPIVYKPEPQQVQVKIYDVVFYVLLYSMTTVIKKNLVW